MVQAAGRRLTARVGIAFVAGLTVTSLVMAGLAITATGTARAAVPDKWGFAFVDKPMVAGIPDLSHQAGTWPVSLHVHSAPGAPGQVFVRFPQLAAEGGIVHVTAVNAGAVWCQAQKWGPSGPSELVAVRCFEAGGAPVFSPFAVLFTTSTPGPVPAGQAYSYLRWKPGSGIITSFNSSGGATTVTPGTAATWKVTMAGLGSAAALGGVQITAVNPHRPAKCAVGSWSSNPRGQVFGVRCYGVGSLPLRTGWTLSYQRKRAITGAQPKRFAYAFDNKPFHAGPYAPAPAGINFNSLGGVNTVRSAGAGLRLVGFPRVGNLPDTVLVTQFTGGPGFCNLNSLWATPTPGVTVRDVACYSPAGTRKNRASLVTYTSAH
jgi:hypothetical protein